MTTPPASRVHPPLPLAWRLARFALVDLAVALAAVAGRAWRSKLADAILCRIAAAVAAAFVLLILPRAVAHGAILLDQGCDQVHDRFVELREFLRAAGIAARMTP